jgi:bis(5'-nucleosyl)-tetraphosphatase (symmetrical)
MSTYVVGDVQGCYEPLCRLLEEIRFDSTHDTLVSVGDLINRGPDNVGVLRLVRSLGPKFLGVLGNHDLNFLAVEAGLRPLKGKDTTQDLLRSPEREHFVAWLCALPLARLHDGHLIVHAGVGLDWTVAQTLSYAGEVSVVLQGPQRLAFLKHMYGDQPDRFSESLIGFERLRVITNVLTRQRFCAADGRMDLDNKLGPDSAPAGMLPWFRHSGRVTQSVPLIFGHWAALDGHVDDPSGALNVYPVDTGCVWGKSLTCLRLEDRRRFSCKCPTV